MIERAVIFAKAESRDEIIIKDLPAEFSKNDSTGDLEQNILTLIRRKKFSRNSINETAKELGGLNRGTITEYLRGILLRELSVNRYDLYKSSESMAGTSEVKVINDVKRKNEEYLINIQKHINKNYSLEKNINNLKKKYKNLPKRYHVFLEEYITHLLS